MTNDERKQIVVNAINEYHAAKASGSREKMIRAINGMENTYIAVSLHAVDNTEVLRRLIIAAKEEIKNIITPAGRYRPPRKRFIFETHPRRRCPGGSPGK